MRFFATSSSLIDCLKQKYFLPSLKDNFEVIIEQLPQVGSSEYGSPSFSKMLILRNDFVEKILDENCGKVFVYGEVDIQFFKPVKEILLKSLGNNDVVFQNNTLPNKRINVGFWVCRANKKLLTLWRVASKCVRKNLMYEEDAINALLRGNLQPDFLTLASKRELQAIKDIKWDYLPDTFYTPQKGFRKRSMTRKALDRLGVTAPYPDHLWVPGRYLHVPKDIVMHHANYTIGTQNKIAQLKYVRKKILRKWNLLG